MRLNILFLRRTRCLGRFSFGAFYFGLMGLNPVRLFKKRRRGIKNKKLRKE